MAQAGKLALCGKYPCHHICVRVQHCPAGQERVAWYALFDRVTKGRYLKPERYRRTASGLVDTETGEIVSSNHNFGVLNAPERKPEQQVFTPRPVIKKYNLSRIMQTANALHYRKRIRRRPALQIAWRYHRSVPEVLIDLNTGNRVKSPSLPIVARVDKAVSELGFPQATGKSRAGGYGTRILRQCTSAAFICFFLLVITLAFIFAAGAGNKNIIPNYQANPQNLPPAEWIWDR